MTNYRFALIILIACVFLGSASAVFSQKTKTEEKSLPSEFDLVFDSILPKPKWLFSTSTLDICPLKIMSKTESKALFSGNECDSSPKGCLEKCISGNGRACYWLAVRVQKEKGNIQDYSEALFLRGCKYGVSSGCTNRAAGIFSTKPEGSKLFKCAADTFEKTCERDDPWGCTMFGLVLTRGITRSRYLDQALRVLSKSCKYGEGDPACQNAKSLVEEINNLKRK